MENILTVNNLNVTYVNKNRRVMAVRNASLSINKGDSLGIVGESGSGKSTLAMALLRLHPKSTEITGEAMFEGKNLLTISDEEMNELRWVKIAVVFQKAMNALSPVHRISQQIEDIYRVHFPKATSEEIKTRALELLKLVNLPERVYNLYPHEMSGGMLQRAMIAAAIVIKPRLLLLDEPTTALDVTIQAQILELLKRLNREYGISMLFISHNLNVVRKLCSRVAVMQRGKLVEEGPVEEIFHNPRHEYTKRLIAAIPTREKKLT